MGAALTQVSAVFGVTSALNVRDDSLRGRINELVSFSVRNAHLRHGEPEVAKGDRVPDVQSRMGASLLFLLCDSLASALMRISSGG